MQPPVHQHAFRRSRITGCTLIILSKLLGLALLSVGVCIKLAIQEIVGEEDHAEVEANHDEGDEEGTGLTALLLAVAVGSSLILLFGMRVSLRKGC